MNEWSRSWPGSGMTVDGTCFPLSTWARRTSALGGSALVSAQAGETVFPTPTAAAFGTGGNGIRKGTQKQVLSLQTMAARNLWPTPVASTNRKSTKAMTPSMSNGRRSGGGNSSPPGLEQAVELSLGLVPKEMRPIVDIPQVAAYQKRWPTPTAGDAKSSGSRNLAGSKAHAGVSLTDAVLFGNSKTSRGEQVAGLLNPTWVEWLMGYPSGWTELKDLVTQWFRDKQGKRSKD